MTAVCHAPVALCVFEVAALERVVLLKEEDVRVGDGGARGVVERCLVFAEKRLRRVDAPPGANGARLARRVGAVECLLALRAQPPGVHDAVVDRPVDLPAPVRADADLLAALEAFVDVPKDNACASVRGTTTNTGAIGVVESDGARRVGLACKRHPAPNTKDNDARRRVRRVRERRPRDAVDKTREVDKVNKRPRHTHRRHPGARQAEEAGALHRHRPVDDNRRPLGGDKRPVALRVERRPPRGDVDLRVRPAHTNRHVGVRPNKRQRPAKRLGDNVLHAIALHDAESRRVPVNPAQPVDINRPVSRLADGDVCCLEVPGDVPGHLAGNKDDAALCRVVSIVPFRTAWSDG